MSDPLSDLPTPGPLPPGRTAVLVLVVVAVVCLWLLHRGMPPVPALGCTAGIGLIAAEVVARLAGARSPWSPRLAATLPQPG
ncbi:hypothetical protein [Actinomadura hibisca]|uniref:hypothetical protein n=1 Tax=Actinomadura hibisca TaxID=68565 RepID=UPI0008307758|nr:hypothetical protein [Actinomadura hibisca]